MNWRKITTIYRKELLDLFRDKRTIFTSFVLPIVLYPFIMIMFTSMMQRQELKLEQQDVLVYINDTVYNQQTLRLRNALEDAPKVQVMNEFDAYDAEMFKQLIDEESVQAVVQLSDSTNAAGYAVIRARIFYNKTDEKSEMAFSRIDSTLNALETDFVGERLQAIDTSRDILDAVDVDPENIAPPAKMLGFALGKFLPYLLMMLTISSGAVVASDLVAGEKERGTLETILVSAAKRNELVIGKYLTIITISGISVLLNLFSMYLSFHYIFSQAAPSGTQLELPLANFALILVLMIPLLTLFSAILLSVSTYARNTKEANSYQMPVMMTAMLLAMISMLPGFKLTTGFALIPVVNFALLFRDIMLADFSWMHVAVVIGSTLVLDVIAVITSVKLFNNERILFRTEDEQSLKFWGKEKRNVFTPQTAGLLYMLVFLLLFYVGGRWQAADIVSGILKSQFLLIVFPVLLLMRIAKADYRKEFGLRVTSPANFGIALLSSVPLLILVIIIFQAIDLIFPVPKSFVESMNNLIIMDEIPFWKNLLIIAALPGLCEEFLFRGYILRSLRSMGKWPAILITGVLFGILHMSPFRIVPTALLGIWMGYLAWESGSLLLPMFAHMLNNALSLFIGRFGDQWEWLQAVTKDDRIAWWLVIPAGLLFYVLVRLFASINASPQEQRKIEE